MTYYERNLPHWLPEAKAIFVTWRLQGSLPTSLLARLRTSREPPGHQFATAEQFLDHHRFGPAWLKNPSIAQCVQSSILKGANELQQYALLAYVVMPNRVHLLIEPVLSLERITRGIKGTTAHEANRILKRTGVPFWQGESFDHWVRTPAEGEKICTYIENNPVKAGLANSPEQWPWSSAAKR